MLVWLLYLYIKLCYLTIRWKFIWPNDYPESDLQEEKGAVLFAVWHSELAYAIKIFGKYEPVKALASQHTDGKIISKLINLFGFDIIEGSTNRGATKALKSILFDLKQGINIVITPDGPRGPAKQINSSITKIASKYGYKLVAASVKPYNCFKINSWDQMMLPLPFTKVKVTFSKPIKLSGDNKLDDLLLTARLNCN